MYKKHTSRICLRASPSVTDLRILCCMSRSIMLSLKQQQNDVPTLANIIITSR